MSGLLMKGFSQTIEHETKEQRSGSLDLLLDTLGANIWQIYKRVIRTGSGVHSWIGVLMVPHPLTNFEL